MTRFFGGKLAQYALVLFVTISLNFILPRAMPGSPIGFLVGEEVGSLTPAERQRVLRSVGLDRPLHEQYLSYLGGLAHGDLGYSYQRQRPIAEVLADRLPWTLLLTGIALALSTLLGIVFGALAGWRRGRRSDLAALAVFIFLESLPGFWLAMILVAVFAVQFGIFPTFGARELYSGLEGAAYWFDIARHLALPVTTLTLITVSATFLTMRASMLSVLGEEYVTVARGKGLRERQVLFGHAVRNALLPVATVFLLNLGQTVAGATVIETVFSYPGVGRLMYEAVLARDYPTLQGGFLVITLSIVAGNLLADLAYPLLDPRVTRRG
ncbi:MAG: ABC transporter permease [Chloroflexi bacterium]|nr:ABC transporter permease [Chloroflexota bacterium]